MKIILIFLLLILPFGKCFIKPNPPKFSDIHKKYIGNLLEIYANFTFVFHVENPAFENFAVIYELFERNVHQTMFVYNYDSDGKENIVRQFGARFLNLVVMEDIFKFEPFSKEPGRMAVNDVILLLLYNEYDDEEIEKWVRMGQHNFVGNVLILDVRNPKLITLNSTIFYAIKGTKIREVLESTNATEIKIPSKALLTKDFENLNGFLLRIGFIDYFPYIFCVDYENRTLSLGVDKIKICNKAIGAEAELLKVLSVYMNFSYKLVSYPGQSHAFIFNKVAEKRVDLVVGGITRTYNRALNATFTISHITEGYTFLYKYQVGVSSYLLMFLFPFQLELWFFIIFIVMIIGFLTYTIVNYNSTQTHTKISIYRSLTASINAPIEQIVILNPKYLKNKQILKILHLIWWLSCIWITTYYKGKLASIYVKPPHKEPTNLQRIIENGYGIIVNEILKETILELYEGSADEAVKKAAKNTVFVRGLCPVINYTLSHRVALLQEFGAAKYNSQKTCPDLIGSRKSLQYDHGSLRTVKKPLVVIPHGWPLPKGTPFTFPINMYKLRLRDAGYINQWLRLSISTAGLLPIQNAQDNRAIRESNDQVSIKLYLSAFLILIAGYIVSVIVFISEWIIVNYFN